MPEEKYSLSIVEISQDESKTTIDVELDEDIVRWFKANRSPSGRWNSVEFKKWFGGILCKGWITLEAGGYKTIYQANPSYGTKTPKKGDLVSFYKNGYRTRVVAEVAKKTIKLGPLWEGDSHGRVTLSDVIEIVRPRKRLVSPPRMHEAEDD